MRMGHIILTQRGEWYRVGKYKSSSATTSTLLIHGTLIFKLTLYREYNMNASSLTHQSIILLGSIPMWPCLPQGESLPFSHFFVPCFSPVFQPCFELVFLAALKERFFFWFFLLQVPINRQATEGKISESHHSNSCL